MITKLSDCNLTLVLYVCCRILIKHLGLVYYCHIWIVFVVCCIVNTNLFCPLSDCSWTLTLALKILIRHLVSLLTTLGNSLGQSLPDNHCGLSTVCTRHRFCLLSGPKFCSWILFDWGIVFWLLFSLGGSSRSLSPRLPHPVPWGQGRSAGTSLRLI